MEYTVRYQAGTYSGIRLVKAEDGEEAINKVRSWVRKEMSLPMYSDSYSIIEKEDSWKEISNSKNLTMIPAGRSSEEADELLIELNDYFKHVYEYRLPIQDKVHNYLTKNKLI